MFILVQADDYTEYRSLLDQMYRLRKRVFHDDLGWDVAVTGDAEIDAYDALKPAYLLWTNETADVLVGSLRLMPTVGPTLLNDVFRSTYPDGMDLCHPRIWEGTRMCVDMDTLRRLHPGIGGQTAMCLLLLALGECALANGIETLVSNYEPHMRRIYRNSGADLDEIGRSDGFGRRPVCCGLFRVDDSVLLRMREALALQGVALMPFRDPAPHARRRWMARNSGSVMAHAA